MLREDLRAALAAEAALDFLPVEIRVAADQLADIAAVLRVECDPEGLERMARDALEAAKLIRDKTAELVANVEFLTKEGSGKHASN